MSNTPTHGFRSRWLPLTVGLGLSLATGGVALATHAPLHPGASAASLTEVAEVWQHTAHAHGKRHHGARAVVRVVAELINVKPRDVVTELRQGKTLAQIVKAHGKTVADAETAIRAAVKTRLAEAVKSGRLTQKQADDQLKSLDIGRLLNMQWPKDTPHAEKTARPSA